VAAVVLESAFGSQYEDTPSSYEFPERYLRHFSGASASDPLIAVIYEPRGANGVGRMSYVGVATISRPPSDTGRRSNGNERLFRAEYDRPASQFAQAVGREIGGSTTESWLAGLPRGRSRNVATFGRAVRPLTDADLERILLLGNAPELGLATYPVAEEHAEPPLSTREWTERLVLSIQRDARFRESVLEAYQKRCAISGFGLGPTSATRAAGVLEAAHIRPVGQDGPDAIVNGLPLTPTLHRLFDAGLFTVRYDEGVPVVRTSTALQPHMISVPDRGFELPLHDGLRLITPANPAHWPSRAQLAFHERNLFRP
jgi:putative restriction endonuclease